MQTYWKQCWDNQGQEKGEQIWDEHYRSPRLYRGLLYFINITLQKGKFYKNYNFI